MDSSIENMSLMDILNYASVKAHELIEKERDEAFDKAYNDGFDDATERIIEWMKNNQSKLIWGLREGLELSGVADEIRQHMI